MKVDILAVSETWIMEMGYRWEIEGFRTYRCDRIGLEPGGGTLLLTRSDLTVDLIPTRRTREDPFEVVLIKFKMSSGYMYVMSLYCPPETDNQLTEMVGNLVTHTGGRTTRGDGGHQRTYAALRTLQDK